MHTLLLRREVSMQQRTIRTTVTPFTASSTIPLRVVTTVLVRPMSIVWQRFQMILSTSVWHKACLSHVNTVVCWPTVHSVVHR